MSIKDASLLLFFVAISWVSPSFADSIHGCGGFVEASSSLIKGRKPTDAKLDYSHITVELRTVDGLLKDSTQCAPNGYYFIPVYDKGSFVIKINGPEGWSWNPEKVPVVVDHTGCNGSEDINFRFTGFSISGRVVGAVGGGSCSVKTGGPSNIEVELLSDTGDVVSSVLTSAGGNYLFKNIIPGNYELRASHPDLKVEIRGSTEVKLGFGNGVVDDIFYVPGYDIRGFVVSQGNPILGVHVYLYSDDVLEVDCPQGSGSASGMRKALCHAVSDAHGMYQFVPQIIFLNSLFGYLSLLIIVKWCTGSQADLYHVMIYMFLSPTDDLGENQLFLGQKFLQILLLLLALVAVPWMLFPKPYLLKKQHEERHQGQSYALLHGGDDPLEEDHHQSLHGHEKFEFTEVFVHQLIRTIEFVLGAVSNTASYLRLWALSLAHSELSSVFYDKILLLAWGFNNVIILIIGIIVFICATVGVLLVMETLSAFLHALRLHWVEFQNKFYEGSGYKFYPFSFALLSEEDE